MAQRVASAAERSAAAHVRVTAAHVRRLRTPPILRLTAAGLTYWPVPCVAGITVACAGVCGCHEHGTFDAQ